MTSKTFVFGGYFGKSLNTGLVFEWRYNSKRVFGRIQILLVEISEGFFLLNTHLGYSFNFTVACHRQVMGGIPPPSGDIVSWVKTGVPGVKPL